MKIGLSGFVHKKKSDTDQNRGYWDIHNHILPGVDDGSSCVEESCELIRMEHRQGIRNIVFTPHFRPGMFPIGPSVREHVYLQFVNEIEEMFPDMHFYLGCELYAHEGMTDCLNDVRCRMAGTDSVLIEFSPSTHFSFIEKAVRDVTGIGYQPILAHVERYGCLYKEEDRVFRLIRRGALIQVNAGSFLSRRSSERRKFVLRLMEENGVDFIASDAHDIHDRPVQLEECIRIVEKQFGTDRADQIFKDNPASLFSKSTIYR